MPTDAQRHERITEIYLEVCELSAVQAARRLIEACADDAALQLEILGLLAHDAPASGGGEEKGPQPESTAGP